MTRTPHPPRQRILITGASSGLGAELARRYAGAGRDLALCARRADRLEALRAELLTANPAITVSVHPLDVTDDEAVTETFEAAATTLGGLDRVIANAGIGKGAPIGTGRSRANLDTARTNVLGTLAQAEAALSIFRRQTHGHLVLVSSISADRGLPGKAAAYSASKAAVSALGEALATELRGTAIAVTTLVPGYIATDLSAGAGASAALTASLDRGVSAMITAVEREPTRAALPGIRWRVIDTVLRHAPHRLTDRMV
ncbi:SDR family oxidoreductase [Nocardia aurantia]|uniref:Putative oxidoreductase n=1 Tax=Nocardia aurantia TaxID=2585199 RepID=A0A7K0DZ74_9NOCA|nr:SDR family oxidoreductase [Nocardia aurantia]MQY30827.1 putative oxidoreductase [Nocardia aurantia]